MDLQKFLQANLVPRQATLDVPQLAAWFGDKPCQWTVRGMTAAELFRCNAAGNGSMDNARAMIEALAGDGDKAAAIRKAIGIGDADVPGDVSKRIEMLTVCSVSPEVGPDKRDAVVKLAESFPLIFTQLTTTIIDLSHKGAEPGKLQRSGKTPA